MKKIIVLLSISILLITGCSVEKLDDTNLGKNISILLSDKTELYNTFFDGFKYYVPKGLKIIDQDENNAVFIDKEGNKYYLYIDVISYYHKTKNTYMVDNNIHYSNKLKYNGKSGYINIEKIDGKFYIQFLFNYAKMEAFVSEDDLTSVVNNMCYVLRTVKFNDKVLDSLVGDNVLSYKEEEFKLFKKKSDSDLLKVIDDNDKASRDDFLNDEEIDLSED